MRKTKIIATIGPASNTKEKLRELMETGINACRLNFSHGSHESHLPVIENIKAVREELELPIPLILDTKGPEIRTGNLEQENIQLTKGQTFIFTTDDIVGNADRVSVTYEGFPQDLKIGARVLVDDGLIELVVTGIKDNDVICTVKNDGLLGSHKGINLPDVKVNLPALTEKDLDDIKFGIEQGFDYIAASFIRSAKDVLAIKRVLKENGGQTIKVISKIESREGVKNLNEILSVTDAIMVARGDLGVEIPFEEVPVVQKQMIHKCIDKGIPVITATQMLESMVHNPRPTRAEASDVANAIYDGTDAIMLSGESAKGDYPVQAVQAMVNIAESIESSIDYTKEFKGKGKAMLTDITNAICHAVVTSSSDLCSQGIIAVSNSGFTIFKLAKFRPSVPLFAYTANPSVARQLNIVWGTTPGLIPFVRTNFADLFNVSVEQCKKDGYIKDGQIVMLVGGTPVGKTGNTNTIKAHVVGEGFL